MDVSNTMQLAIVTPDHLLNSEVEVESDASPRRGWLNRGHQPRKHRVQDENARLKRELKASQDLAKSLSEMLSVQLQEREEMAKRHLEREAELVERINELKSELMVAREANLANAHAIDFDMPPRPVDSQEEQATMPVPQVYLLEDGEKESDVDPATALLDRVVPKEVERTDPPLVPAFAPSVVAVDYESLEEIHDETQAAWNAKPHSRPLVSWGGTGPTGRTLKTDQSVTGTFRVVPLNQRDTGPSGLPGLAAG